MEIIWENESQWQFFFAITIHFCDSAKRDGTAAVFLKSRQRMQRIDSEFLSEVVKVWMSLNTLQSINFISKLIVLNK